jgi:hypothetical protein
MKRLAFLLVLLGVKVSGFGSSLSVRIFLENLAAVESCYAACTVVWTIVPSGR